MSLRKKLHIWHLTPLALVALIVVAVIIWIGRGDFSTRDITVRLDGPVQIENSKLIIFHKNQTVAVNIIKPSYRQIL